MRVLTVRQPWAWAIIHGQKDVENRTRNIAGSYRGPVAIHAGKAFDFSGAGVCREIAADYPRDLGRWRRSDWTFGAIIGVVDLVDVHPARSHYERIDASVYGWTRRVCCGAWAMHSHYHLVLANPRPFAEPIPAKGKLGLWKPDADLLAQIAEARQIANDALGVEL